MNLDYIDSLLLYIIIFSISIISFYLSIKVCSIYKYFFLFVSFILPLFISAARYAVGTDYFNYINYYFIPMLNGGKLPFSSKEYAFILLIKFATLINEYQVIFIISSMLILLFIFKGIWKYNSKYKIYIYIMYIFLIFPTSFNNIRQNISIAILIYNLNSIFEKNLRKYILFSILAILFHSSSIIFLPMYFIYNKILIKNGKRYIFYEMVIYIFLLVTIMLDDFLLGIIEKNTIFSRYGQYFYKNSIVNGNNYEFYLKLLIFLTLIPIFQMLKNNKPENKFLIFCLTIDLIFCYTGFKNPYLKRIGLYYSCYLIFLLPEVIEIFSNKFKIILKILIVAYSITMFLLSFYVLGMHEIFPYKINTGEQNEEFIEYNNSSF